MIYCLQQFRPYVLGHLTVIRSNHAAWSFLKRTKEPIGQQVRWLDFMEKFSLQLEYRRSPLHGNANALSRRPCEESGKLCRQCSRYPEKANQYKVTEVLDFNPVERSNEADAGEETELKRVATATRSRAQNRPESGMVGQTEPDQTAGLVAGLPQAAHDLSRQAGGIPGAVI